MTGMLSDEMVNRQVDMLLGVEETQQAGHDSVTVDMVELTNQQPRATTGDDPRLDPLAKNPGREVLMRPGENKMPGRNDDVPGQDLLAHASQPAASQSKLQMLPFKVEGSYCVIGNELDSGPSRVQLVDHPLSTNDYTLCPKRVKEARLTLRRFFAPSGFVTTMLSSSMVVLTTTLAMYISILSTFYTVDVNKPPMRMVEPEAQRELGLPPPSSMSNQTAAAFVEDLAETLKDTASVAAHGAVTIYSILYPIITTYLIMNMAWEYALRQELYYLFLHYKVIIDFENWAWSDPSGKKHTVKLRSFFPYWIIGSTIIITVFNGFFAHNGGWTAIFTLFLQSLPMYVWWDSTISMEKRLIPMSKFLEMKSETGEGMDLKSATAFIGGCTVVPEDTLRALAASHPATKGFMPLSKAALEYCCPYPMYWLQHWESCCHRRKGFASDDQILYKNIVGELKSEGDRWWERRADYRGSDHFKPGSSNTGKFALFFKNGKERLRRSHWATFLMRQVLTSSSDFHEIRHLILQYNAWTASVWNLLTWGLYIVLFSIALWFRYEAQGVEAKNLAFASALVDEFSGGPGPSSAQAAASAAAGAAAKVALFG